MTSRGRDNRHFILWKVNGSKLCNIHSSGRHHLNPMVCLFQIVLFSKFRKMLILPFHPFGFKWLKRLLFLFAGNIARALYGRLSLPEETVPLPYRINKPFIEGISNSKIATNVKPGKSCMNWVASEPIVEFINTKTGKTCDEKLSRLCKLSLFKRYLEVSTLMKKVDPLVVPHLVYRNCKEHCQLFQQVKKLVFDDLENSARGKWIAKPKELNEFCVSSFKEEWLPCV